MSQQFGADAVISTSATTLTNGVTVTLVTGNNVTPPYGNCKIKVRASVLAVLGSVPTNLQLGLIRNINGENVTVGGSGVITLGVAAGVAGEWILDGIDLVPDGRPCQYSLTCNAAGTGTNGTANRAYIEATVLSG